MGKDYGAAKLEKKLTDGSDFAETKLIELYCRNGYGLLMVVGLKLADNRVRFRSTGEYRAAFELADAVKRMVAPRLLTHTKGGNC